MRQRTSVGTCLTIAIAVVGVFSSILLLAKLLMRDDNE